MQPTSSGRREGGFSGRGAARLLALAAAAAASCSDLAFSPQATPGRLSIVPADTLVTVGDTVAFHVMVLDEIGSAMPTPPTWTRPAWSAADEAAVRMLDDGRGVALKPADTKVTVQLAGLLGRTPLRVNPRRARLSAPVFYLTQGIQDRAGSVPLIAGREALLRVFATIDQEAYFDLEVRATLFRPDGLDFALPMRSASRVVPTTVDEGDFDQSFNAPIPPAMITPGTTMIIELDPEGTIDRAPGSQMRIPATGRLGLNIRRVPPLALTVAPIVSSLDSAAKIVDAVRGLDGDSEHLRLARAVLPVGAVNASVREPYATSVDLTRAPDWVRLLEELTLLYKAEGLRGHLYGAMLPSPRTARTGIGYISLEPIAAGELSAQVIAHELGHNMSLKHAPCGGATAPDKHFPYTGGAVGVWGYDFHAERVVFPGLYKDVMGYCTPAWGSDYHFKRALAFRLSREAGAAARASAQRAKTEALLLWGNTGRGPDAGPRIEPAFVAETYPSLPEGPGPYRIDGTGAAGEPLFSFSFDPVEDEFGGGPFAFAVPLDPAWEGELAEIVLTGPDGEARLRRDGESPAALVRDPATGRVRAIVRDWSGQSPIALEPGLEVVVSDGIPGPSRLR